ncbi:MAG: hypothetical protein ACO201_01505 [Rickettsiales bacterium]
MTFRDTSRLTTSLINISRLTIPPVLAENIRRFAEDIVPVNAKPRRNLEWQDILRYQPKFIKMVKNHPEFTHHLAQTLAEKSKIIYLQGLNMPSVDSNVIPQTNHITDSEMIGNRDVAICKISSSMLLGLLVNTNKKGKVFQTVYPTDESKGSNTKFDGDRELLWHNDGWNKGVDELTILVGVKGHEAVKTKVILAETIIDYFKKNGKEEELKYLMCITTIAEHPQDFDFVHEKIIDPETNEIRFAKYGCFGYHQNDAKVLNAIKLLQQYLEEIDPDFSESLQSGDMLILQNKYGLHARETSQIIGTSQRMLLRSRVYGGEDGLRESLPDGMVSMAKTEGLKGKEGLGK